MTGHRNGISALVSQTSFGRDSYIAAQFNKARVTPTSQPLQMTLVSPEVGWPLSEKNPARETCVKEKSCKRGYRSVSNRSQKASKCGIGATVAYSSCSTCSLNAFLRQWWSISEHCKNWQGVFRAQLLFRSLQPKISSKLMKQYVTDLKSYVNLSMSYKRRHVKKEIIE